MDYYDSQMLALQIFCESPMLVRRLASCELREFSHQPLSAKLVSGIADRPCPVPLDDVRGLHLFIQSIFYFTQNIWMIVKIVNKIADEPIHEFIWIVSFLQRQKTDVQ